MTFLKAQDARPALWLRLPKPASAGTISPCRFLLTQPAFARRSHNARSRVCCWVWEGAHGGNPISPMLLPPWELR